MSVFASVTAFLITAACKPQHAALAAMLSTLTESCQPTLMGFHISGLERVTVSLGMPVH